MKPFPLQHTEIERIREVLVGRKVVKAAGDQLVLDSGIVLDLVPNDGCGGCPNGHFYLTELNGVDNVITDVGLAEEPLEGDSFPWFQGRNPDDIPMEPVAFKLFVYADNVKINLATVEGDIGNGWYGQGFSILVTLP